MQKDDDYPQQVCQRCVIKLNTAYNFQQTVLKSHNTLTDILETSKQRNEETPVEPDTEQVTNTFSTQNNAETSALIENDIRTNIQQTDDISKIAVLENRESLGSEQGIDEIHTFETGTTETEYNIESVIQNSDHNYVCRSEAHEISLYYVVGDVDVNDVEIPKVVEKKCEYCQYKCADRNSLKEHLRVHKVKCEVCHRMIYEHKMKQHRLTHSQEKAFQCNVCQHKFATKLHLDRHVGEYHRGRKKRSMCLCSHCGASFSTESGLSRHMSVHTGRNLRTCDLCRKHFLTRHSLVEHFKSHEGIKPYPCVRCQINFTQVSSLRKHMRLLHTADGRYQCALCQLVFDTRVSLNEHKRSSHGRFRCYRCKISFRDASALLVHNNESHPKRKKPL